VHMANLSTENQGISHLIAKLQWPWEWSVVTGLLSHVIWISLDRPGFPQSHCGA
jgi:hypothetical protein